MKVYTVSSILWPYMGIIWFKLTYSLVSPLANLYKSQPWGVFKSVYLPDWAVYCLALYKWKVVSCSFETRGGSSEFMVKTFQAAQLTHERYLAIDHSSKILFWYLPNWTSTNLWSVALYVMYSTTHQRCWKFSLAEIRKIFCRSDPWSKISHVLVVQLETFSP